MKTLILTLLFFLLVVSSVVAGAQNERLQDGQSTNFFWHENGTAISSTDAFGDPDMGSFTFQGILGAKGTVTGNYPLTHKPSDAGPQMDLYTAEPYGTGTLVSPFESAGSAKLRMLHQIECSTRLGDCARENLFKDGIGDPDSQYRRHHRLVLAPEPTAGLLLGTGLLAAGTLLRRRARLTRAQTETEA